MPPAARISDMHVCPLVNGLVPHVGGPVSVGFPQVLIGMMPAARVGDMCVCVGPPDPIAKGSPTVLIGGMMAARMGDLTSHGGNIVLGFPTVIIGEMGMGRPVVVTMEPLPPVIIGPPKSTSGGGGGGGNPIPKGCEYLKKGETVEAPRREFDNIRDAYMLAEGGEGTHTFPGDDKPSKSQEYTVTVKGHDVKVIMPDKAPPEGKHLPTADQVAKGLACVPEDQLGSIKEVVVSPNRNPDDAYWAKEYHDPDFFSAATGGDNGVTYYPSKDPWSQAFVDSTTIHEGGHTYSQQLWKDEKKKKAWENAIKKDGSYPSKYAENASTEDFSESLVMYSLSKGTKCEDCARAMFPNRYKILDDLFKKKDPAPPPSSTNPSSSKGDLTSI